jgi:hypothetical protein
VGVGLRSLSPARYRRGTDKIYPTASRKLDGASLRHAG